MLSAGEAPEDLSSAQDSQARAVVARKRLSLTETCANPGCASGWLHLWRGHSAPVFEAGWSCSAACTEARVALAVARELEGASARIETHRHRIPLGLTMLEQGWIDSGQLRRALDAQRSAGGGRLGHWLVKQQAVSEELITRALGLQWRCPVLTMDYHDSEAMTALIPRLFVDAFGALPLRVAAAKILYLGFEDRLDPVVALAVERMTGLRVECGLVEESLFRLAHNRMLGSRFPQAELIEASSEAAMAQVLSRSIEKARPVESRLVRVHDCLWLRMWFGRGVGTVPGLDSVQDLICSIGMRQGLE
jgi:hypothetical protein